MSTGPIQRRQVVKLGALATAGIALGVPAVAARAGDERPLITRPIPSSGEQLPVIGLGTNAYGVESAEEMAPLREVVERMPQLGGTVIDTARVYGRSEAVLGQLIEELGNRDQLFLASKTPIRGELGDPDDELLMSLRAMRVERLDLMQIHNLHGLEVLMPAFERARDEGRVRYIGVTTNVSEQYAQLMDAMRRYPLDFIQCDYSIDNRDAADEVLELAAELEIAVLANMPFGGRRNAAGTFARVADRELPEWAAEFDAGSWAQVFLKYVASHPAVTVVIPGTTRFRNLEDNQRAGRGRLPDADMRRTMEAYWDTIRA